MLRRAALSSCLANSTNVYRLLFGKGSSLEILKRLNFDTSKRTIWNQLMTLNLSLSRKCLPCLRNVFPGLVKHCCSPQLCPCGTRVKLRNFPFGISACNAAFFDVCTTVFIFQGKHRYSQHTAGDLASVIKLRPR